MRLRDEMPPPFEGPREPPASNPWVKGAAIVSASVCLVGFLVFWASDKFGKSKPVEPQGKPVVPEQVQPPPPPPPDLHNPVRPAPSAFPPDSNLPRGKEIYASGPIDLTTFNPTNDIIRFEDSRVWFDSDNHHRPNDADDHLIHRSLEVPLKRLVNLLAKKRGTLKIQDAYRAADKNKIHLAVSLHCEGRAVDLTCDQISLSDLAKLAWQSGFDFVLYEKPVKSGLHLHCSVKRSPDAPLPPRPEKGAPAVAEKSKQGD